MINFFKHIRKSYLMENKTGKYFKYAIGEIILVVIGILIALQINNWNENRKENIKTLSFLENIKNDLVQDTIQINRTLKNVKYVIEDLKTLLKSEGFTNTNLDSSILKLGIVYYKYSINKQTYDKLVNSGITELANSKTLFDSINLYYTKDLSNYNSVRDWDILETNKDGDLYIKDAFEMSSKNPNYKALTEEFFFVQTENERLKGFVDLVTSVEGRNRLRSALYRKVRFSDALLKTNQSATKLLNLINNNLDD